jgi:hypothetical protein
MKPPIYERGTPAWLREHLRHRLTEAAWDAATKGNGSGAPTGITTQSHPRTLTPGQHADAHIHHPTVL